VLRYDADQDFWNVVSNSNVEGKNIMYIDAVDSATITTNLTVEDSGFIYVASDNTNEGVVNLQTITDDIIGKEITVLCTGKGTKNVSVATDGVGDFIWDITGQPSSILLSLNQAVTFKAIQQYQWLVVANTNIGGGGSVDLTPQVAYQMALPYNYNSY
jgi:hypothetical protein